ncbi:MAG: hypothetical protein FJ293_10195 [Planctomycetes bacterium]|nr:hypothetical protein [Planctomycetota bacterium]
MQPTPTDFVRLRRGYLDSLRSRSCYRVLRLVLSFVAVLSMIPVLIGGMSLGTAVAGASRSTGTFLGIACIIVGTLLVIAAHQAMVVILDIADVLIDWQTDSNDTPTIQPDPARVQA